MRHAFAPGIALSCCLFGTEPHAWPPHPRPGETSIRTSTPIKASPPAPERNSTSFSRAEFDGWLAQRRADEGLPPVQPRGGRPVFKSWLRDVWEHLRELPEARGLGLFCERDVTMVVAEVEENVFIADRACALRVLDRKSVV